MRRWLIMMSLLLLPLTTWAFQAAPVVENCNRTANPLGSGWLGNVDPDITLTMTANGTVCVPSGAGQASAYWGTELPANQVLRVIAADATTTSTHAINLLVRVQQPSAVAQTVDLYRCQWQPAAAELRIQEVTNGGSSVTLAGPLTNTVANGDALACQIIGNTITAWQQPVATGIWTLLLTATDTSITGPGFVGLHLTHNQLAVDDIGFGPVTSTRLGLHATADEVPLWFNRSTAGPYTAEWTRILGRANAFVATPEPYWLGNQLTVAWHGDNVRDGLQPPNKYPDGTDTGDDRTPGDELRDAAFVYRVTGNTSYRTPVITWLLAQAAISGVQFSNTTKWSPTYTTLDKDFNIAIWLRKVVYAYSDVRAAMSVSEQGTMDTWFNAAGTYWALVLHNSAKTRFPNRLTDDYTTVTFTCVKPVGGSSAVTHLGGWAVDQFGFPWDNKRTSFAAAVTAIGATTGNPTLLADGKRYFKEWLRSNVFPDGTSWEQARWTTGNPQSGFNYGLTVVGSASTIADHVARTGDTELYTYTTSLGNCGSEGGPKSLLQVLQRYANIALGNTLVYASLTSTSDPNLLIDSSGPGGTFYNDVNLAQPNVFYQDPLLKSSYTRTMPDTWNTGGYDGLGGDWGHLPAARFMFGQMEGLHWPYLLQAGVYVDNTQGCPGAGTSENPYCSLQVGLDHLTPGATLKIRTGSGVYDEYATTTARQGTVTAPITVEPDSGAAFVLRNCDPGAAEAALEILDSDYWTIQGLIFDGSGCSTVPSRHALNLQGVTRDITGVQVLNNIFRDWRQTTGAADGPEALRLAGNDTTLGGAGNFHAIGATVQGNTFSNIDLTAMRLIRTQGTLVEANTISAMRCGRQGSGGPAETIGIHYTHSNTTLTLRSNLIENYTGYLSCPLTSQGVATVAGIWCDLGGGADSNNVIERNTIHGLDDGKADLANAAGTSHSASGIFLEEQCAGTLVKNNVLYDIGTYGIRNEYHATGGTSHVANEYYHNSLYDMLEPLYLKEGVAIVKNNLVAVCRGVCIKNDDDADNTLTIDGNLYSDGGTQTKIGQISPGAVLGFTAWKTACGCDATSINADPQLAVVP